MQRVKKAPKSRWKVSFVVFSGIIILLIGFAFLIKIFVVFTQSKFDGQHQLVIDFIQSSNKATVVAFSPENHQVSILDVVSPKTDINYLKQNLEIPIDSSVAVNGSNSSLKELANSLFFHHAKAHTNLTIADAGVILFTAYTISPSSITKKNVNLNDQNETFNPGQLFFDNTLYNNAASVSVINATGESGIGSNVARMLSNMGANVISVTTASRDEKKSTITYIGKKGYSQIRISEALRIPLSTIPAPTLSDIMIIIGKDRVSDFR